MYGADRFITIFILYIFLHHLMHRLLYTEEADVQDMLLRCPCLAGARLRLYSAPSQTTLYSLLRLGLLRLLGTKQLQDDGVVTALAHGFRCHLELLTVGGRKVS